MQKKLLLLYIAKNFEFPLTEDQFIKVIGDNDWMTFFDYKDNATQLIQSGQLSYGEADGIKTYRITQEGLTALTHFEKDIPPSTKQAVQTYIDQKREQIKTETLLEASYRYMLDGRIEISLQIREKSGLLLSTTLFVENERQAQRICENWRNTSPAFYETLMNQIL